jgi:hypothetical protein
MTVFGFDEYPTPKWKMFVIHRIHLITPLWLVYSQHLSYITKMKKIYFLIIKLHYLLNFLLQHFFFIFFYHKSCEVIRGNHFLYKENQLQSFGTDDQQLSRHRINGWNDFFFIVFLFRRKSIVEFPSFFQKLSTI